MFCFQLGRYRHLMFLQKPDEIFNLDPVVAPSGELETLESTSVNPSNHGAQIDIAHFGDITCSKCFHVVLNQSVQQSL
jgi:hypothetical protein